MFCPVDSAIHLLNNWCQEKSVCETVSWRYPGSGSPLATMRAEVSFLMAFSVNEVACVVCQSRSWFVLFAQEKRCRNKTTTRQTSYANDFVNAKGHARENPLLAGYPLVYQDFRTRHHKPVKKAIVTSLIGGISGNSSSPLGAQNKNNGTAL